MNTLKITGAALALVILSAPMALAAGHGGHGGGRATGSSDEDAQTFFWVATRDPVLGQIAGLTSQQMAAQGHMPVPAPSVGED